MLRPSKSLCVCGNKMSQVAQQCLACRRRREARNCIICGLSFLEKPGFKRLCCSRPCSIEAKARASRATQCRKINITCQWCGRIKFVSPAYSTRKFCSRECAAKANSGPLSRAWKGGVTKDYDMFYGSREWKSVCRDIWARANAHCERCGKHCTNDGHVHHIKRWAKSKELRLERSNLALLCVACHRFVHSARNTEREFC